MKVKLNAISILLALFLSGCMASPEVGSPVDKITGLETDYVPEFDGFLERYALVYEQSYDTAAKRAEGLTKFSELLAEKDKLNETAAEILKLAKQGISNPKNDIEKEYFEKVQNCYNERSKALDSAGNVLYNYYGFLKFLNHSASFDRNYEDLAAKLDAYVLYSEQGDYDNAIKTLNAINVKIGAIKEDVTKSRKYVSLGYQESLLQWADELGQVIDMSIDILRNIESEDLSSLTEVTEKAISSRNLLTKALQDLPEQKSDWFYNNVEKLDAAIPAAFNEANKQCESAAEAYAQVYI